MACRVVAVLMIVVSTAIAAADPGLAQPTGIASAIHQGHCDDVGDGVAPLVDMTIAEGEPSGNAAALPAANSFTTVPISLEALAASDHAIVVPFPVGEEIVACGEIGGTLTEAGALNIGIGPQGDMGISGIAYLSPGTDPTQTNISLFLSGDDLETFLDTTFLPLPVIAPEDASRFAAVLATRDSADSLAGPFAGTLVQRGSQGAGVTAENFSATVTFVNPQEQTEMPWDVGLVFHQNPEQTAGQAIGFSSDGSWYHQDAVTGALQVAPQTSFDATPGATNTLDLVVDGTTALFTLNGEMLARIDLPAPTASDVFVTTGFFAENIVTGRELVYSDFEVWAVPAAGQPAATPTSTAAAQDDAKRFAAALAARSGAPSLAGPFGGTLGQRQDDQLTAIPAGISAKDFSATVTFVNPTTQTEMPWDFGLAFHQNPGQATVQEVYLDSNGFWYHTDFPNGVQQSGTVPSFEATPGGINTLDLIVDGSTALFGVNGEFVASLDLPPPTAADVLVATDFRPENIIEGREIIYSTFEVWDAPTPESLAAEPASASAEDDAARFAAALAERDDMDEFGGGPLTDTLIQEAGFPASLVAEIGIEDLSATVAFDNPTEQTDTPWDYGFAFHPVDNALQDVFVDSDGFWYYQGTRAGWVSTFDGTPGVTNTLDVIVQGDTALFGVNSEFVASLDVPTPTTFRVGVVTGLVPEYRVEGREIGFTLRVWT
jgi:hypothetical protein